MKTTTASAPLAATSSAAPWYQHRWPWLLMAGPGIVVVAGVITTIVAFKGADGLVADDYYKQGLAVNRQIARDAAAVALNVRGEMAVDAGHVRLNLTADGELPEAVSLRLAHPFRAGEDRVVVLKQATPGGYVGFTMPLTATRWLAIVETPRWRVSATLDPHVAGPVSLSPGVGQ